MTGHARIFAAVTLGIAAAYTSVSHAAVSADEAKQLGTTLTPFGAEKAGNKEGTIPEYNGGLTTPPAGFVPGPGPKPRPDPFPNDKPLYSIDAKNMDKYADKLTEGAKAMMTKHPGFRIDVYPTRRTVAYPQFVLDNTVKNATRSPTSRTMTTRGRARVRCCTAAATSSRREAQVTRPSSSTTSIPWITAGARGRIRRVSAACGSPPTSRTTPLPTVRAACSCTTRSTSSAARWIGSTSSSRARRRSSFPTTATGCTPENSPTWRSPASSIRT